MKTFVIALSLFAAPAFAASEGSCSKFVTAAEAAGKRVGKPYPAQILAMLKASCVKGKDSDETVDKRTACVEKAKTDADLNACNK